MRTIFLLNRICPLGAAALLVWLVLSCAGFGQQKNWTMFHNLDGENISAETGLLNSWPEEGLKLLWKASEIGEGYSGYSSVAIQNGRLYTTGNKKIGDSIRHILYCFDLDGNLLWTYDNGPGWLNPYEGTRSTPTLFGRLVYDLSPKGQLVCLDGRKGKPVWTRNILDDFEGEPPTWGLAESVVLDGDNLICCPGGKKAAVVALDKTTGKTIWEAEPTGDRAGYATAIIVQQDGIRIWLNMTDQGLLGLNPNTGKQLFYQKYTQKYGVNAQIPLYHDGQVVVANTADFDGQGATAYRITVHGQDDATLEKVWQNRQADALMSCLMRYGDYIYGYSHTFRGGVWICLRWSDGKTVCVDREKGKGCLAMADGLFYCFSELGRYVTLKRPTPEKNDIVSQFRIPDLGQGNLWAHPVICDGRLYIRHSSWLFCYDVRAQK